MKESDPDKSEREHSHDTDVEEPDLGETEREESNDIACVPFHYARVPPLCMDSAIVSNFPSEKRCRHSLVKIKYANERHI